MEWFKTVFLPSLEARMTNPKYPNQIILSPKQADICYKYMNSVQCHGDYGYFTIYEIKIDGKLYQMTTRGKYTFLTVD